MPCGWDVAISFCKEGDGDSISTQVLFEADRRSNGSDHRCLLHPYMSSDYELHGKTALTTISRIGNAAFAIRDDNEMI